MSKTIKTITTLKKHVGDTVHVVSYDGYEFDAKIVDDLRGGNRGLFTTDQEAKKDSYWWSSGEGFAHITVRPYQITEELKSITLVKDKIKKTTKTFVSADELKANVGHYCKMSDGTEGFIVMTNLKNPRILMSSTVNGLGWSYNGDADDTGAPSSVKSQYKYAWNVCDDGDAEDISVVEILDDEKSAEPSKTLLDMTIREALEKLDEIIISR